MKTKYKLVPIVPTKEMVDAAMRSDGTDCNPRNIACEDYRAMLDAAPQVEKVGFCEDAALSLAERTFSTEVDEQLAEDIIQYARRLHSMYTAPQPAPEVVKLVEALEEIINPVWFMQKRLKEGEQLNGMAAMQIAENTSYLREIAEAALAAHLKQGGDL